MLLQTNSYIVPKEKRAEHSRLLRRFRAALSKLGCDNFEIYEQVSANWAGSDANGRFVQIMRFRNRQHQIEVQQAERNDPAAQGLIREFCELINFPYQQQQGLFAVGYYTSVLPVAGGPSEEPAATDANAGIAAPPDEPAMAASIAGAQTGTEEAVDHGPSTGSRTGPEIIEPAAPREPQAAVVAEEELFAAPTEPIQSESARLDESYTPIEQHPERHPESDPLELDANSTIPAEIAIGTESPGEEERIITESPAAVETAAVEPLSFDMPEIVEVAEPSLEPIEELRTEEFETLDSEAIGKALDRALDADVSKFDPRPARSNGLTRTESSTTMRRLKHCQIASSTRRRRDMSFMSRRRRISMARTGMGN